MKVFIGILLATIINFLMGLLGLYVAESTFVIGLAPKDLGSMNLSSFDYIFSFCYIFLNYLYVLIVALLLKFKKCLKFQKTTSQQKKRNS